MTAASPASSACVASGAGGAESATEPSLGALGGVETDDDDNWGSVIVVEETMAALFPELLEGGSWSTRNGGPGRRSGQVCGIWRAGDGI